MNIILYWVREKVWKLTIHIAVFWAVTYFMWNLHILHCLLWNYSCFIALGTMGINQSTFTLSEQRKKLRQTALLASHQCPPHKLTGMCRRCRQTIFSQLPVQAMIHLLRWAQVSIHHQLPLHLYHPRLPHMLEMEHLLHLMWQLIPLYLLLHQLQVVSI